MSLVIACLIIAFVLFSGHIASGMGYFWGKLKALQAPALPSVDIHYKLEWWKALLVGLAIYLVVGGVSLQGCSFHLPHWSFFGPSGPATILVAYEEGKSTPEFADLIVDFQDGATGQPFKDAGHTVYCLDNDTTDEDGKLAKPLEPFKPYDDDKPEVIVSQGVKQLFRLPLTYKTSAEELTTMLHGRGL